MDPKNNKKIINEIKQLFKKGILDKELVKVNNILSTNKNDFNKILKETNKIAKEIIKNERIEEKEQLKKEKDRTTSKKKR